MNKSTRNAAPAALDTALAQGLEQLDIALPAPTQARLLHYVALLAKWNRAFNLTAVRDPAAMLPRHLLDSLAVLPWLRGPRVLDVGSGAGLPGIPLALAQPDAHFTLLDSNGKKTRFMTQAVAELGLTNITVVQARIDDFRPDTGFDTVLARAFAAVPELIAGAGPLCAPGGQLLLMKGAYPQHELDALPSAYALRKAVRLQIPGLDAERHLLIIEPRA